MDPALSETRDAYLAGTMSASRMMTLVGEMPHDRQLDVCSLVLPELPLPFDELVMDRAKLRQVLQSPIKVKYWSNNSILQSCGP